MLNEAKSASGGKTNTIILGVILLLVVGGLSFGVGYKVAQGRNNLSNFARNNTNGGQFANMRNGSQNGAQNGQGSQIGMRGGNRQTVGEVVALDDKTMTVKLTDGSSKIVLLSSTMTVNKSVEAAKTDLKIGSKIAVFGDTNNDGSVTATNIELDPKLMGQGGTSAVQK